ncbi:TetR/AcrR family transcriptional regulator [Actinophytocola oryzae]|uniref:TetR family transcriptional regulator n=1 Tax=Actinophytocola oryzae TaxID=502181 RepID=A0A4R7VZJ0_9PSEU|nr:TetR/AcrR family transcriptional regulator [Actinophytocola oryzae]TDV55088.1 TetR family transcriptional regulator [Actinophytocola oryzae]
MRADARRNYERLLTAAHEVFAEQGTNASLEEIARRAGVGIGTLYRHFPTREELLVALLNEGFTALRKYAEALLGAPDPREALAEWLARFASGSGAYRGLSGSVLATSGQKDSPLYDSCHGMRTAGARLITHAQQAGVLRQDVDPMDVLALAGAVSWVAEQMPDDGGLPGRLLGLVMDALAR